MRYYLAELIRDHATIDRLQVQSFEGNIYLVKLELNGLEGMLYEDNGSPKRFKCSEDIKQSFADVEVLNSELIQYTAYDEMIGNPPAVNQPLQVPFSMR